MGLQCGYPDTASLHVSGFYDIFSHFASSYKDKAANVVWAGMDMLTVAGYVTSKEDINAVLGCAKDGIRNIMAADANYAYLTDLKNYYKEASLMYGFIADFNDNYSNFTAKLDDYRNKLASTK